MVISSQHNRAYFTPANHLIEMEGYLHSSNCILIKNTCLCTHHELILFCIPYPIIVVQILTAPIDVDTLHSRMVCFYQIFVFTTQADPPERTVAVIKELGSHNIFDITRPDKSVFFINTIIGDFFYSGIVYGFHERVSIIKEISSAGYQFLDELEMTVQRYVYQVTEFLRRFVKKACAFLESQSGWAVSTFVNGVTGGLIG